MALLRPILVVKSGLTIDIVGIGKVMFYRFQPRCSKSIYTLSVVSLSEQVDHTSIKSGEIVGNLLLSTAVHLVMFSFSLLVVSV